MKTILLIKKDPLAASFYSELLQTAGLVVSHAEESASALALLDQKKPDLILIDPLLPEDDSAVLAAKLKDLPEKTRMLVFGDLPPDWLKTTNGLASSAIRLCEKNPARSLLEQLEVKSSANLEPMRRGWQEKARKKTPELLNRLRQNLRDLFKDQSNRNLLRELYVDAQSYSERAALTDFRPVHRLTKALIALIFRLYKNVELVSPSTLRSLSEAIDFLAVLHQNDNAAKVQDSDSLSIYAIDDDSETHRVINSALEIVGLQIEATADPAEGLRVLANQRCDLLLLDINLPGTTGFALCAELRKFPLHARTPVIFLTGVATFENRVQSSLSGGNAFLAKPFNLAELALKALVWVYKGQLQAAVA